MLRLLDVSNFWSPTGGGVRRYQMEKLAAFSDHPDVRYALVVPSDHRETEVHGHAALEHVPSAVLPGSDGYRQILTRSWLQRMVEAHQPDVIECGSPWIMPFVVQGLRTTACRVGFWHADFPHSHVGRRTEGWPAWASRGAKTLAWHWARRTYGRFDAICCASRRVAELMMQEGLQRIFYTPLGVHAELFHPDRRDAALVARFRAGDARRAIIVFAHRLNEEKGLSIALAAHAELCRRMTPAPALVVAGHGPGRVALQAHAQAHEHVHILGYMPEPKDLAPVLASSDLALSLSAYETFGLSTAEAMASGTAVLAANAGAAAELVESSGGGRTAPRDAGRLADAVAEVLEGGQVEALGRAARRYIEPFTWARCFERQRIAYASLVEARDRGQPVPKGLRDPEGIEPV